MLHSMALSFGQHTHLEKVEASMAFITKQLRTRSMGIFRRISYLRKWPFSVRAPHKLPSNTTCKQLATQTHCDHKLGHTNSEPNLRLGIEAQGGCARVTSSMWTFLSFSFVLSFLFLSFNNYTCAKHKYNYNEVTLMFLITRWLQINLMNNLSSLRS